MPDDGLMWSKHEFTRNHRQSDDSTNDLWSCMKTMSCVYQLTDISYGIWTILKRVNLESSGDILWWMWWTPRFHNGLPCDQLNNYRFQISNTVLGSHLAQPRPKIICFRAGITVEWAEQEFADFYNVFLTVDAYNNYEMTQISLMILITQ